MKSRIILIIVIVVIVIVAVGIFALKLIGGSGNNFSAANGGSGGGVEQGAPMPISQAYPDAPTGNYLSIGTPQGVVQTNNFYTFGSGVIEGGVLVIKTTPDYWFTYDPASGSFWIVVSSTPFTAIRPAAEQDFLGTLGVSQADACKLNVSVGVPYAPGNPLNGESFPLSFCSNIP